MNTKQNIFCASNPARLVWALWTLLDGRDLSNDIIFLPSQRAVRTVKKFITEQGAALPKLVALGEEPGNNQAAHEVVSNQERVIVLAKMLVAAEEISFSSALSIASDLVRMQDYISNETDEVPDWMGLINERYAQHFQKKAEFLQLADSVMPSIFSGKITEAAKRNADIRGWIEYLKRREKGLVIVCGSTASVPATADLMCYIAGLANGRILLPGKISDCVVLPCVRESPPPARNKSAAAPPLEGGESYLESGAQLSGSDTPVRNSPPSRGGAAALLLRAGGGLSRTLVGSECNPYVSELKFLERIDVSPDLVRVIDVGGSNIDFFNAAFSNAPLLGAGFGGEISRIDCVRESEEANVAAEIASAAICENKTVLVITPDAAGNQRLAEAFRARGLVADFSGGVSGAQTIIGRKILNALDEMIENKHRREKGISLFGLIEGLLSPLPEGGLGADEDEITEKLRTVSGFLSANGIDLSLSDMRSVIFDVLSGIQVRPDLNEDAKIKVLGTIESRMQTADVIILTGLNEGMFPALGYENPWLPRKIANNIGLPPPERKVSLMAMDFINLSCGPRVYWLRSKTAGGNQTIESRFLSRVRVGGINLCDDDSSLKAVRERDNVPLKPLDYSPPRPPRDMTSVYVTELELLIHNPYAFYAKHILGLRPKDDWWIGPGAKEFGTLVHGVIEVSATGNNQSLVEMLDNAALKILPKDSVLFHFWHKRFVEMAPAISEMLKNSAGGKSEIKLETEIAGRKVKAIADRVWNSTVLDIKTGAAPNKKQLLAGNMPQLPLEAFMQKASVMQFLQLRNNDIKLVEYSGDEAKSMIEASVQKLKELFGRYANDLEPYEYYENTEEKYKSYDDLARVKD